MNRFELPSTKVICHLRDCFSGALSLTRMRPCPIGSSRTASQPHYHGPNDSSRSLCPSRDWPCVRYEVRLSLVMDVASLQLVVIPLLLNVDSTSQHLSLAISHDRIPVRTRHQ